MKPKKRKPKAKYAHLFPWARLDRDAASRRMRIELGSAYELLREDVDFGLWILQQAVLVREELRPSLTAFAALMLFQRGLEQLDAVDTLVGVGAVNPARAQARSFLEAILGMLYLITVNDERVAAACLVTQSRIYTEMVESVAAQHAPGSRPTIQARELVDDLHRSIVEDRLSREANREIERLEREQGGPVPWYQAFGGPRTLAALSRRVNEKAVDITFDLAYSEWSRAVHLSDVFANLGPSDRDDELFRPLRQAPPAACRSLVTSCHTIFASALARLTAYFGEGLADGLREWIDTQNKLFARLNQP